MIDTPRPDDDKAISLTEGELTKRLEGVVVRLMNWCDCGGEGCDLCHSAKAVTLAATMIVKLQSQLHEQTLDVARVQEMEREVARLKGYARHKAGCRHVEWENDPEWDDNDPGCTCGLGVQHGEG